MNFTNIKKVKIPQGKVRRIIKNDIVLWKKYTNLVPLSIDENGNPYNNGLGYKDGYRVRSGGAEYTNNASSCTGFIPLKIGETLYISTISWYQYP